MKKLLLVGFLLMVGGVIALVKYLPWYASLAGFVGLVVVGKYVGGKLLERLFLMPFKAKGRVLQDARVQVHGVQRVAPPEDVELDEDARQCPFYVMDVSITPAANPDTPFRAYNPQEIELVDAARTDALEKAASEDRKDGEVVKVEVFANGAFQPFDGEDFPDCDRFRLFAWSKPGVKRARFAYYFQRFGEVELPA